MLWQVSIASMGLRPNLNRKLTEKEDTSIGKVRLLEERECFCTPRSILDRAKGTSRPVPWPVEPVGPMPRPVQQFGPENLSFSVFFFSNT